MRLTFKLDDSVRASVPNRKILYFVDSTIHTVDELIDKLKSDLGLPTSPMLSVDDFVVFSKSPIQILREEDVIKVSINSQSDSKSTTSATSLSSEDDTSEDKAENGQGTTSSSSGDALMETESSDSSESEGDNSSNTGEALNGTRNAPPDSPLNYWNKLTLAPKVAEVLVYKIVEITATWEPVVSPWRYGVVVDVDLEGKEANSVITLAPWPDPQVHPDPRKTISASEESEEDEKARCKKQRTLEIPRSEYSENGQLMRQLSQFVDIRMVDAETVEQYKKASVDFGIKKRKQGKRTEATNGNQRSCKVAKKGVAGVLSYLRNV